MSVLPLVSSQDTLEGKGKKVQEAERHKFNKLQDKNKIHHHKKRQRKNTARNTVVIHHVSQKSTRVVWRPCGGISRQSASFVPVCCVPNVEPMS